MKPGVGVPIDGAVGLYCVGWVALLVEVLAILAFDSSRIPRPVGKSDAIQSNVATTMNAAATITSLTDSFLS